MPPAGERAGFGVYALRTFTLNCRQHLFINVVERIMAAVIAANQAFDMKFEVAVIPVSDIDRSKRFYEELGWRLDADFVQSDESRAVQLTPPGSPSSIQLGPRPAARFYLVGNDIEVARAKFVARGMDVSEIFHRGVGKDSRLGGPDPERRSYASYVTFGDPDGNDWLVQEVTQRLPGRVSADTATFTSSTDLAAALRRAAAAHGEHEKRTTRSSAVGACALGQKPPFRCKRKPEIIPPLSPRYTSAGVVR
jgi:catechol 2,3-dioxygenase-like lactoylglutathione lyase family enzyme